MSEDVPDREQPWKPSAASSFDSRLAPTTAPERWLLEMPYYPNLTAALEDLPELSAHALTHSLTPAGMGCGAHASPAYSFPCTHATRHMYPPNSPTPQRVSRA